MNIPKAEDRLGWIDERLQELQAEQLLRTLAQRSGPQGVTIQLDGRELINFSSNDYLDLAGDSRLSKAAAEAVMTQGTGSGASPLVAGRGTLHAELERRLARFMRTEAALLFSSGFAANVGTIPALVGRGDAIFSDQLNHASLIDGCRLSRADVHVYPHADCWKLAEMLAGSHDYRRRLIVTDALFSMDGDAAPLAELAELAERFDCMLIVDEAHALGVFGRQGRGKADALGVADRVDVLVGTLSKALGSAGGFVAGRNTLIQWLANRARAYVFSTAQPPAAAAAALAALDVIEDMNIPGQALLERAERLRGRLAADGWNTGASQSQIIPLIVGDTAAALKIADRLLERGFYVPAIRPPTVPSGKARLRISLTRGHSDEIVDLLVDALEKVGGRR
jgi:8-amino-7-oxononanoate synthase